MTPEQQFHNLEVMRKILLHRVRLIEDEMTAIAVDANIEENTPIAKEAYTAATELIMKVSK
jgi:hypothetical protein